MIGTSSPVGPNRRRCMLMAFLPIAVSTAKGIPTMGRESRVRLRTETRPGLPRDGLDVRAHALSEYDSLRPPFPRPRRVRAAAREPRRPVRPRDGAGRADPAPPGGR